MGPTKRRLGPVHLASDPSLLSPCWREPGGATRAGAGGRTLCLALACLPSVPGAALASGPAAPLREAVVSAAGAILSPASALALALAGLWLGLAGAGAPGRRAAALGSLAGVLAGGAAGLAFGAPSHLDALIAGAGLASAGLLALKPRLRGAAAVLPPVLVAALLGLGLGGTLRLSGASATQVAAYAATFLLAGTAILVASAAFGRRLRLGEGRTVRGLGAWTAVLAALLVVKALTVQTSGLDASRADLRVSSTVLSEDEIPALVRGLLEEVYLAFAKEDEGEIYDALAVVAEGDVLADLYLQKRAALVGEETGGARSELRAIELEKASAGRLPDAAGYRVHSVWRVVGSVGHWGHLHDRVNRYEADLAIAPVDGSWKIAGFDLLDVERTDAAALP